MGTGAPGARAAIGPGTLAGLALAALGLALHARWLWFVCDDAFISFRYAAHWVAGHGLVFNPGERVEGYTNFLWVVASAGVLRVGGRPEVWMPWLGTAAAVAVLAAGMLHLARRGGPALVFGALLAAHSGMAAWASGGLETALFTACLTGAFLAALASRERAAPEAAGRALLPAAPLLLAASLARPEGLLVGGLLGLDVVGRTASGRLAPRGAALWAALWLVPYAAYFAWRWSYYDQLLPNSFAVKAQGLALLPQGLRYLADAALRSQAWLWLAPAAALLVWRRPLGAPAGAARLTALVVLPYLAYVAAVGGDFMDLFRFAVPVVPIALVWLAWTWRALETELAAAWSRRVARVAIAALLALNVGLALRTSAGSQQVWYRDGLDSIGLLRRYTAAWTELAFRLRGLARPGDRLATTAAGVVPYYTGLTTLDQFGLMAPDLSRYAPSPEPRPGHSLLLTGEALLADPPHFLLGHPFVHDARESAAPAPMVEDGWLPEVAARYRRVVLRLPGPPERWTALLVRRDVADARGIR